MVCFKDKATEYERAVFRALSALVGEEMDLEVAIERHFEVRGGRILKLMCLLLDFAIAEAMQLADE